MASKALPSPEVLRQLLRYEPETGKLFWRPRPVEMFPATGRGGAKGAAARWNARDANKEAFTTVCRKGYRTGSVFGQMHRAHRVIWAISTGAWPAFQVDHRDGDPGNNQLLNLREATCAENAQNRRVPVVNTSGFKGVYWHTRRKLWQASIGHNGRIHYLGYFATREEANSARLTAESRLFGDFARSA